jgi:nitroreductase
VVILVRHPDPKWTVHADAGAAAQNMLVAAWSLGLGTCWAGSVNHRRLRALLDIPEIDDLHIFSVVSFGVPDESPVVEVAPSDPPRAYRDEGGVLHVEKRPLAEVIHVDGYRPRRQPVE